MLAHIRPAPSRFTTEPRPNDGDADPGSKSEAAHGPPSAQSPFARFRRYLQRRDVWRRVGRRLGPIAAGHWHGGSGHPARRHRDLVHRFGSVGYAKEDLRAEIASRMVGDWLGMGHDPGQRAAYVNS